MSRPRHRARAMARSSRPRPTRGWARPSRVMINCRFWTTSASGTPLFGGHLEQRIYNEDDNK